MLRLQLQEPGDALAHALQQAGGKRRDQRIEIILVDRGDLRGVGHRVAWQAGHSLGQQSVAWCRRQDPIATALLRRRNAPAAGSSPGCPARSIARFQAAVVAAGCRRRFKKSRAATASTRLRDIFISWAQASISRNRSSAVGTHGDPYPSAGTERKTRRGTLQ
jgi:hypothetical protein